MSKRYEVFGIVFYFPPTVRDLQLANQKPTALEMMYGLTPSQQAAMQKSKTLSDFMDRQHRGSSRYFTWRGQYV